MKKRLSTYLFLMILTTLLSYDLDYAQTITIQAGYNQIINWEKTHSTKIEGCVTPDTVKVEWTCPQNSEVNFKNASKLLTEVTFPRPGYYLLVLRSKEIDKEASGSVIINVFKPNSYKERLSDLIGLMTLDEKIKQMITRADPIPRLGLPAYNYWNEALHGILAGGVTSFPQGIALGATWDPDLVKRVATVISDEARVKNIIDGKGLTYWSPTINIARDPRWGRNEESYSEDPYLLSRLGVAFIKGMQGDDPYYFKTIATPKHFMANNEEQRRHTGSSDVDMRNLFEYYLPAFKQAIIEGRAYSIMGAYNELNHTPCNANTFLLTDLLRRNWGFEGYVVSDCGAINDMFLGHKFFKTGAEAAARSVLAGCDINCESEYRSYLPKAIQDGLLEEKDLDRALERVLSARFRLGEFDPAEAVTYKSISKEKLDSKENRELALEAAQKSIVLLKNNNNILPLKKDKIKSIAVMGPNAAEVQLGIYSGTPNVKISPLDGIKEKAASLGIKVDYLMGCELGGGVLRPIESQYFTKLEGTNQTGMKGEYFDNMKLSGKPVVTRIDSMINFNFGTNAPAPGIPEEHFSVRWSGKIIPPENIHKIGITNDDGARLYIDGKLVIDDWKDHAELNTIAQVELTAGKEYEIVLEFYENELNALAKLTWDLGLKDFDKIKQVASKNDAVILILGISPALSQEELDRNDIELPLVQRTFVEEVSKVNKKVIVVLVNGGPLALAGTENKIAALVEAWYGGEFAGKAIADILFGEVNPSGKLPETFYASTKQLPPMSNYDIINHPRTYMYFDQPVLYPFGHGLSYTKFDYNNLKLSADKIKHDGEIDIQFSVQNSGKLKGDEIAQLYVHSNEASFKVPINQLKRFQRITLAPGEKETLLFKIPVSEFSFYNTQSNDLKVNPGKWEIQVGSSSKDIRLKKSFTIE